ncbi:MAG: hypothetical protein OHK0019_08210 [Saprospiraceae bacterium]
MKTLLSKINLATLALLLLVLAGFSSCKKDDDDKNDNGNLREAIVGEWEVTSFTFDGVEVLGTVITYSKMEFETYTGSNGDFEWNILYGDGSSENQIGDYEVDEEDNEVELQSANGSIFKLEAEIKGDKLELSGILDGERVVVEAERD